MELKPRLWYLVVITLTTTLGFLLLLYSFWYFNVLTLTLHSQFVYYDKAPIKDKDLFNYIVSGLVSLGGNFGYALSGFIQNKGRRLTMIVISLFIHNFSWISMIFDMYALFIARFLMGVVVGDYATIPLIISEISSISLLEMSSSFI